MKPTVQQKRAGRRRRLIRIAVASAIGFGLGQLCPHLPERLQPACQWVAKLTGMLVGGS
jgi:hypothetical protein